MLVIALAVVRLFYELVQRWGAGGFGGANIPGSLRGRGTECGMSGDFSPLRPGARPPQPLPLAAELHEGSGWWHCCGVLVSAEIPASRFRSVAINLWAQANRRAKALAHVQHHRRGPHALRCAAMPRAAGPAVPRPSAAFSAFERPDSPSLPSRTLDCATSCIARFLTPPRPSPFSRGNLPVAVIELLPLRWPFLCPGHWYRIPGCSVTCRSRRMVVGAFRGSSLSHGSVVRRSPQSRSVHHAGLMV